MPALLPEIARPPWPIPGRRRATTRGIITLVQEGRFQLVNSEGGRRLFLLAHDAPLELADLHELQRSETPVQVECGDAENLLATVAYDVEPLA